MRLSRFFIDDKLALQQKIAPADAVAHYMRHVLRLKPHDEVLLFDGRTQHDYRSTIELQGKKLLLTPFETIEKHSESPLDIHLLLAIGKPEHIDLALQKTTELGVTRISLFNSERTQTPIKGSRLDKKLAHWRGVLISACEQSGRNSIPELAFSASLQALLQDNLSGNRLMLDFDGVALRQQFDTPDETKHFHCLIGAEGGLSSAERELAQKHEFKGIYLGPRVLRMETAAIAISSLIQHQYGDL